MNLSTAMQMTGAAAPGAPTDMGALVRALDGEARLLGDLQTMLRAQRQGVASDDVQAVDDSVFGAHRIMRTLEQAREQRRSLTELVTGSQVPVDRIAERLGNRATPLLQAAVSRLLDQARSLSRDIAINRVVLREAIAVGDAFVRALSGSSQRSVVYDAGARSVAGGAGHGALINQRI